MSIKLQILFVACIVCALAIDAAVGRPDSENFKLNPVEDTDVDVNGDSRREKREDFCGWSGGCYKGRCWANCQGGFGTLIFNGDGPEWCYTTKGYSQDFKYVSCSNDRECNRCWKCAGSCTV